MHKYLLSHLLCSILLIFSGLTAQCLPILSDKPVQSGGLCFIENIGQVKDQFGKYRSDIDFRLSDDRGMCIFIGSGGLHYQWIKPGNNARYAPLGQEEAAGSSATRFVTYRMDVSLRGANTAVKPEMADMVTYRENYLQDKGSGTIAHACRKIIYKEVYPHIDWILYIRDNGLEYDFVVRPGGKVSDIQISYGGASSLRINTDGSLTAQTPMGSLREAAPYSFQDDGTKVASRFLLNGNCLGFQTGAHKGTLTIDPKLDWATYYGGPSYFMACINHCDRLGNVYLASHTYGAANIATTGAHQDTFGGGLLDGLLVKFNTFGTRLWATYIGGEAMERMAGIVSDSKGNVYVAGTTQSANGIATAGSHKSAKPGFDSDVFLVKFDSSGNRVWGTYFGGEKNETGGYLACDAWDNIYLACGTASTSGIVTAGCHQPSLSPNIAFNSCIIKFDSTGSRQWGTYYDGVIASIACDSSGVYIAGEIGFTGSPGIATPGCYQDTFGGGVDMYLARFNGDGVRQWGTYYGGKGGDNQGFRSLCLDQNSNLYIAGITTSRDTVGGMLSLATTGSHQPYWGGGYNDIMLAKFNKEGRRIWGSYYGGEGFEYAVTLNYDNAGSLYLAGYSSSNQNIATAGGYQDSFAGGYSDGFLVRFDTSGQRLWGTYYGGTDADYIHSVESDLYGNIYIAGTSISTGGIATQNGFRNQYAGQGAEDGFLAKFCHIAVLPNDLEGKDTVCEATNTYAIAYLPGASYAWSLPPGWTGQSDSNSITLQAGDEGGTIEVAVIVCGDTVGRKTKQVFVLSLDPQIAASGFQLGTTQVYERYQWLLNGVPIPGASHPTYPVQENGAYQVIAGTGPCSDTSSVYLITNYTSVEDKKDIQPAIRIYPNPSAGKVHIRSEFPVQIRLSSLDGRLLIQQKFAAEVDLSDLPAGTYILQAFDSYNLLLRTVKLTKAL